MIYTCSIADGKLYEKLLKLNVPLNSPSGLLIKKNRRNIRDFLRRIRDNIIGCWELPETPDKVAEQANKKSKTKGGLVKEVNNSFEELGKRSKEQMNDEEYEEEGGMIEESSTGITNDISEMTIKGMKLILSYNFIINIDIN